MKESFKAAGGLNPLLILLQLYQSDTFNWGVNFRIESSQH